MKEKLPSVRNYATSSVGYELVDKFPLMTRQEAKNRLKCAESVVDKLREEGVLYSINSTWAEKNHGIAFPHDRKFWAKLRRRGFNERVGIRQSDVEDYWNNVRKPFLDARDQERMAKVQRQREIDEQDKVDREIRKAKEAQKPFTRDIHLPSRLHQATLEEDEHQRIEDMINMRLMQLETDLEFKLANEVKRSLKQVFRQDLLGTRKEIVYEICKDLRNEISGLAEKSMTNFEAINHNMKKMWKTTKGFHEELDGKLSRTYVSFAEVQEKTWKHIKKAVKARTLKPKPSRVSLWRKFMTWASSPTNSTGNNTTEKVGKGKD